MGGMFYKIAEMKKITLEGWTIPTAETWATFAGELKIEKSNYDKRKLAERYWTSSTFGRVYSYINFSMEAISAIGADGAYCAVRLSRTF